MMTPEQIYARLQSLVGDAVKDFTPAVVMPTPGPKVKVPEGPRDGGCKVVPEKWHDVAMALRDDPELRFDFLQCVTGVDWPKQNLIQSVYHLYSYPLRHSFVVKADLPRDNPTIGSVSDVWGSAEWGEREEFDLVGIGYLNHPDLRRVMLPDDWVGHPMRKDWKEPEKYRNMPTTRPSTLDMLPIYDKAPDEKKRLRVVSEGTPVTDETEASE